MDPLAGLATALAIGLIIGLERGWHDRELAEGHRVAGLRTFALIGLAGGFAGLLDGWIVAAGVLGLAVLLAVAQRRDRDLGITTEVAALLAFLLGAATLLGHPLHAVSAAVITALLLGLKPTLHAWLRRIEERELMAGLQLLLISCVVLPLLPDRGYGPDAALNPFRLWLMVVLIAGFSFLGYVAIRLAGARRGVLLTGLFAGVVSSTAATVSLSRHAHKEPALHPALAAGIALAAVMMLLRIAVMVGVVQPALLAVLAPPLGAAALAGLAGAWWLSRGQAGTEAPMERPRNPLELASALQFAVLLAVVQLVAGWLRRQFGDAGLLALATLSGIADVDALTLSVASMVDRGLGLGAAAAAIGLAVLSNTIAKAVIAAWLGGGAMARPVALTYAVMVAAAGAAAMLR